MLFTCKYLTSRNQTQTRCAQLGSLRLSGKEKGLQRNRGSSLNVHHGGR